LPKPAQVVEGHAAADDEHALVAQRCQGPTDRQVVRRVEAAHQAELHGRDVGVGVGQLERHEGAVVEAAGAVLAVGDAGAVEERAHPGRHRGAARRRPGELVRRRREAVVVVEHRRPLGGRHRGHALLPVGRDHEDRLGARGRDLGHAAQVGGQRGLLVGAPDAGLDERPRAAAVGHEHHRQASGRGRGAGRAVGLGSPPQPSVAAVAAAPAASKTSRRVGSVAVGVVMTPIVASLRSRR
jgi:hypothetical protein